MIRREDANLNKEYFNWTPPGRRDRKSKPTWKDGIPTSMKKRNMTDEERMDRKFRKK